MEKQFRNRVQNISVDSQLGNAMKDIQVASWITYARHDDGGAAAGGGGALDHHGRHDVACRRPERIEQLLTTHQRTNEPIINGYRCATAG